MNAAANPTAPGYGHGAIWRIAAPMILTAITVPLLGLVDTAVMGHLEHAYYLAAVAAGAVVFDFVFMGLNFLRMGTTGVTAQRCGAGDFDAARNVLGQALVMAGVLGVAVVALQRPLIELAMYLLAPETEVERYAREYISIRIWAAPLALGNYALIGWLLGMQNARGPLALAVSANGINIALDFWFVVGLGMTADGVALASLIAEAVGFAVVLGFVRAELAAHPGRWSADRLLRGRAYLRLLRINGDIFIRTMALMLAFGFMTAQGARLGTVVLAANALLLNFQYFMAYALDGIAHAAEAIAGRAAGARDRAAFEGTVRRTLAWSLGFAMIFTLAWVAGGEAVIALLTTIPEVREAAAAYLPWIIALPLISVWSFLYDGVFVGATWTGEMRNAMLASLAVFLGTWFACQGLGNHALWLAFTLFMAARGVAMHLWYRSLVRRIGA